MVRPFRFRMLVVPTRVQSSRKGSTVCNPETLAMHGRSRVAIADPAKPDVPSRHSDEYSDVPSMFRTLRALPVESAEFARQRERIAARCLPLAEHIARCYDRRGESLDDLIQVARVGLVKAINRYDPDSGPFFVALCSADHDGRGPPTLPRQRLDDARAAQAQRIALANR